MQAMRDYSTEWDQRKCGDMGAARELLVAYDLMIRGYHVLRPLSPASPFDLVAVCLESGERLIVEVKSSGYYSDVSLLNFIRSVFKKRPFIDLLAIAGEEHSIAYYDAELNQITTFGAFSCRVRSYDNR